MSPEKSLRYRLEVMCGRFTLRSRDRIKLKESQTLDLPFEARYNIAPSQKILAIADYGGGPNAESSITSCAIITTAANELIEALHDRMPSILQPDSYDVWLDPKTDPAVLKKMLAPFPSSKMRSHPVSSAVNYPENDSAELLVRVDAEAGTTASLF